MKYLNEGLLELVEEGRITRAHAMRMQEKHERKQLVEDCQRFVGLHDAGTLPDAKPEAVRLARVVVDEARFTGIILGEEIRDLTEEYLAAESRVRHTGEGHAERDEVAARFNAMIYGAEARIDAAAAELGKLAEVA